MKRFLGTVGLLGAGALSYFATLHFLEKFTQPDCPDVVVVATLVDGCMEGDSHKCDLLDYTVPASCLMERAAEATDARRMRFGKHDQAEEITL